MDGQSKGKPGNEVAVLVSKVDHDKSHAIQGRIYDTNKGSDEHDNTLEVDSKVDIKKPQATKNKDSRPKFGHSGQRRHCSWRGNFGQQTDGRGWFN